MCRHGEVYKLFTDIFKIFQFELEISLLSYFVFTLWEITFCDINLSIERHLLIIYFKWLVICVKLEKMSCWLSPRFVLSLLFPGYEVDGQGHGLGVRCGGGKFETEVQEKEDPREKLFRRCPRWQRSSWGQRTRWGAWVCVSSILANEIPTGH